ncbi:hypothetical protein MNBD_CHLOROFLEXI01-2096 [hydrothermal vent metagenome]|uniref:Death on curing protein, Doc toxin n=1 Tax=hydrothermal vent metagenome TaxID=652676 RepID=A0A3B0UQN4_9ZZZZ
MNLKFQRGDVVLIRFPFTDLSGSKRRPSVILAEYSSDIVVAFVSSVLPTKPEQSDILLKPSSPFFLMTGLKKASVVRLRKVATLECELVTRRLGKLEPELLTAVDKALVHGLGINTSYIVRETYQNLAVILQNQGETAVISYIQASA